MGVEKSIKLVESLKGIDAIFITKNKEIYTTAGMKDKFKIINKEFTYKNNLESRHKTLFIWHNQKNNKSIWQHIFHHSASAKCHNRPAMMALRLLV